MRRILIITGVVGALLSVAAFGGSVILAVKLGLHTRFGGGVSAALPPTGNRDKVEAWGGTGAWEIETVDAVSGRYGGKCSLALDGRGRPHIAYFARRESPCVRYAWWDGKQWLTRTVDASVKMEYCDLKLALDDRERAHVVYNYSVDAPGESERKICKYARWTGEEWHVRDVATGVEYGADFDLVLDEAGRACIAYVRRDDGSGERRSELTYARWDGNDWTREVVAVQRAFGGDVRVMLSAQGEPRVLCGRQFFALEGGLWHERGVLNNSGSGALDADDKLHLAFPDDGLTYARDTESGWKEETVDTKWEGGGGASLVLGRGGLPYISYNNLYEIRFAHFTGEEWVIHTVEGFNRPTEGAYDTWLAVDDDGRPAIAYFDPFSGALKCARWRGGEWRNPPASEADKPKDLIAAGEIVSWYLEKTAGVPEDPQHPRWLLTHTDIYAEPDYQAEVLLWVDEPTEAELLNTRSVRKSYEDIPGETWAFYDAWVEVKVGDVVGWVSASNYFAKDYPNPALVRFGKPYTPLREGPSEEAPVVQGDVKPGDRWRVGASAAAGEYFFLNGKLADWYCLDRGYSEIWAPSEAPGLELFYLTYAWHPTSDSDFWFYLPGGEEVDRVFYLVDTYLGSRGLPWKDPRLEVVAAGETFELVPLEIGYAGGYECVDYYFEFVFPHAVRRDDIEAITFSVGDEGERVYFTIDPHDAWREPATERHWPSRGMA